MSTTKRRLPNHHQIDSKNNTTANPYLSKTPGWWGRPDGLIVDDVVGARRSLDEATSSLSFVCRSCNLHSGICLETVTAKVTQNGQNLLIQHALRPSFQNINLFTNQSEKIPCCGQTKTTMWDLAFAEDILPDARREINNMQWKNNQLTICLPANPLPPSCHRNSPRWIVVHGAALHSSNCPRQ